MQISTTSEKLLFNTVRIQTKERDGGTGYATGFFLVDNRDKVKRIFLVTNRHVVEGVDEATVVLHEADYETRGPKLGRGIEVKWPDFEKSWTFHPDPSVDVAVTFANTLLAEIGKDKQGPYLVPLGQDLIATSSQMEEIDLVEELIFVGYPEGLWDEEHFLPLVRRAAIASHVNLNFKGLRAFMIDGFVFCGSSGSPVFVHNVGSYGKKGGGLVMSSRFALVGVLARAQYKNVEFEFDISGDRVRLPVEQEMGFGLVYRAETVMEAIDHLKSLVESSGGTPEEQDIS